MPADFTLGFDFTCEFMSEQIKSHTSSGAWSCEYCGRLKLSRSLVVATGRMPDRLKVIYAILKYHELMKLK